MSKKLCIVLFLISLFLFSCTVQKGPNMKEGLWEITVKMDIPGMPVQMAPQTYTQCLTQKEAVPKPKEENNTCEIVKQDIKGDTVSWLVECKTKEGTAVSDGTITYKGDTMQGIITMTQGSMKATQHLAGRWIGACKK
ncbi:MAG: hypothetical protein A2Z19_05105 [Deltaproteobacteria bacterium RBG_16_54_18]|nr:MAG: hypothetical protein A2Z19_05105 [Deltaproteobacteria bacterium RBG_16_54_18]